MLHEVQDKNQERGIIKLVILIIIVVLILSYFGISLKKVAESPTGQENFGFLKEMAIKLWDFVIYLWESFFSKIWSYLWDEIGREKVLPFFNTIVDKITR